MTTTDQENTMSGYVRLEQPPVYVMHFPTCSACCVDLEHNGDYFQCPNCGTQWDTNASDGEPGELYSDWFAENPGAPLVTPDQAADIADYRECLDKHHRYGQKMPALFPPPRVPESIKELVR